MPRAAARSIGVRARKVDDAGSVGGHGQHQKPQQVVEMQHPYTRSGADVLRTRLATVRQIIQSSWRPTGGAIRTTRLGAQPPATSVSACAQSAGSPAAADT